MTSSASHDQPSGCDDDTMDNSSNGERMSGLDTLVWNIERDPRLRSTVAAIFTFEQSIAPSDMRNRLDRVSRLVPRMHQRVVNDPLGIAPPRWEVDPELNLGFHFRVTTLGGQGTQRQLHDLAAEISAQPLDRSKPLWEFTLVRGLDDGGCALIIKTHHAVTDGMGGMEMMLQLFDLESFPGPTLGEMPPRPAPAAPGSGSIETELQYVARQFLGLMSRTIDTAVEAAGDPADAAHRLGAALSSARRVLSPVPASESSVIEGRSLDLNFASFSVSLESMRQAGRRVGGTVNDTFVAAIALALSDYHRRFDAELDSLRVSVPVNRRVEGDSVGNHFTPGKIRLDTGTDDPDELMRRAHHEVDLLRNEPANALVEPVAGLLRLLPTVISTTIASALFVGIDVAASNVAGSAAPLFLCGQQLSKLIPFGPLVGCAANVTMVSYNDAVTIGVNCDPAAIDDTEAFIENLETAFDKVIAGP